LLVTTTLYYNQNEKSTGKFLADTTGLCIGSRHLCVATLASPPAPYQVGFWLCQDAARADLRRLIGEDAREHPLDQPTAVVAYRGRASRRVQDRSMLASATPSRACSAR